jgi:formimidoylglutamate deiminase
MSVTRRLWFEDALLPDGWAHGVRCTLAHGRIARIERGVAAADAGVNEDGDERHVIGLPGLLNVHSHAFQRAMAGLAERRSPGNDSFWTWRETMYRFVERLDPDDAEAVAGQAYMEMLEGGFTRVGEFHYLHHDSSGHPYADEAEMAARIAAAAAETGIGLTLLPSFYAHAGFGGQPPAAGQRRFVTNVGDFARLVEKSRRAVASLDDVVVGLAPHSLRAVAPDELMQVVGLADAGAGAIGPVPIPIHIHVAEQMKEVQDCFAWSGARPVEWLLDHAPVNDRWCLIHGTHATEPELRAVASRGAVIGLCPITEGSLGDGIFGARAFLGHGGAIAIGTDSNVLIDAAQELRTLEYVQRLTHRERNVLAPAPGASTGRALLDTTLAGGTRALGVDAGRLAEGASADLISLDPTHPALIGRTEDTLLDAWLFAARTSPIDRVWRAGREVVTNGRHVNRAAIESRFRRTLHKLLTS